MEEKFKVMEEYAREKDIPIIEAEGIEFLMAYIMKHKARKILELGSAIGYSAIKMASVHSDIRVVTVERDAERYQKAIENIDNCEMSDRIQVHKEDALLFETDEQFDLIFIDAAKAQYIKFFERYEKNLNENGVIISDNLKFHGFVDMTERIQNRNTRQLVGKIRKYIDFLEMHENFQTIFYEIGDGLAISKKAKAKNINF